jgi:arylsulfatase A-like enzyme
MKKQLLFIILLLICLFIVFISSKDKPQLAIFSDNFNESNDLFQGRQSFYDDKIENVVFITIDTLRADHLGFMGYPRNTSPFIDRLVRENVVFRNAFNDIPMTNPTMASIFTSLYAVQHKVADTFDVLDDSFITMAELFKEKNFKTGAFVSMPGYFQKSNLTQGFDMFTSPECSADRPEFAKEITNKSIDWINSESVNSNFFLWVHFWGPHFPFPDRASSDYVEKFKLDKENKEYFIDLWTNKQGINKNIYIDPSEETMIRTINEYDTEILATDNEIEKLYNYFEEKGLNEKTLWIITIDHGEGLGSHDFYLHPSRLYNEQVQTPIIFRFPYSFSVEPKIFDSVVENIDILPTIADLIGFSLEKQRKQIQGSTLLPLILHDDASQIKDYSFSWTGYPAGVNPTKSPIGKRVKGNLFSDNIFDIKNILKGEKFSLQNKNYKYIYNLEKKDEFYNLSKDPMEKDNLIDLDIEEKEEFKNILLKKIKKLKEDSVDIKRKTLYGG